VRFYVIVRQIESNLPRSRQSNNQLDGGLAGLGVDGLQMAQDARDVLVRWVTEDAQSAEWREYASQQLLALPQF
jgi:hypothetical protein